MILLGLVQAANSLSRLSALLRRARSYEPEVSQRSALPSLPQDTGDGARWPVLGGLRHTHRRVTWVGIAGARMSKPASTPRQSFAVVHWNSVVARGAAECSRGRARAASHSRGASATRAEGARVMKVVVTGAFGNIGWSAVQELARQGHTVRCFARYTPARRRAAGRLGAPLELVWGDLRRPADLRAAVRGQDAIVHLAAILPPASEERPGPARETNVEGTRLLLAAARGEPCPPRVLLASTFDVFGHTQHLPPPRRAGDPVAATDHYTAHKLACEELVRRSGLTWAIFRFADVPPLAGRRPHPIMFRIPLDTRFEVLHPADAALAIANALHCPDVWGRVSLIGGGPACQVRYRDYLGAMLDALGIGRLPEAAFGHEPYPTDWLDTAESQRLLRYQRHSFEEVVRDVARALGPAPVLLRPLRPLARWWILRLSPYWSRSRRAAQRSTGAE